MISNEAIEEKSIYFMQKVVFSISILLLDDRILIDLIVLTGLFAWQLDDLKVE